MPQRLTLVAHVLNRFGDGRLVEHLQRLAIAPGEEFVDERLRLGFALRQSRLGGRRGPRPLEREESPDELERVACPHRVGRERLEEVPPRVRPAAALDDVAGLVEVVEDRVRVGHQLAGRTTEPGG